MLVGGSGGGGGGGVITIDVFLDFGVVVGCIPIHATNNR